MVFTTKNHGKPIENHGFTIKNHRTPWFFTMKYSGSLYTFSFKQSHALVLPAAFCSGSGRCKVILFKSLFSQADSSKTKFMK